MHWFGDFFFFLKESKPWCCRPSANHSCEISQTQHDLPLQRATI